MDDPRVSLGAAGQNFIRCELACGRRAVLGLASVLWYDLRRVGMLAAQATGLLVTAVALTWVTCAQVRAAIPSSERTALLNFYGSTGGAGWRNSSGWNGPAGSECSWFGITCDVGVTHVLEINLRNNLLTGTFPALDALTSLTRIDVGNSYFGPGGSFENQVTGAIPDLSALTALVWVDVGTNRLSGALPALAGHPALTQFLAGWNQIDGAIPPLTGLPALYKLDLSHNSLNGAVPSLAALTALLSLDVSYNQLTGPSPSLAGATALQFFRAGGNQFTGPVTSLSDAPALLGLDLSFNQLTGSIPSLDGAPQLIYLNLSNNYLSGNIPSTLRSLAEFRVANNYLTGSLPDIHGNQYAFFAISGNQLSGSIPRDLVAGIIFFYAASNQFSGPIPDLSGTKIETFDVEHNHLSGSVPSLDGWTDLDNFKVAFNDLKGPMAPVPSTFFATRKNAATLCGNMLSSTGSAASDQTWDVITGLSPVGGVPGWLSCQRPSIAAEIPAISPFGLLAVSLVLLWLSLRVFGRKPRV